MDEKIINLKKELKNELEKIQNLVDLDKVRVAYLGKKGSVTGLLKGMKELSNEERKEFGKKVMNLRQLLQRILKKKLQS